MIVFVGDKPSPRMTPAARPFEGARCMSRLLDWIARVSSGEELESSSIRAIVEFNPDFIHDNPIFKIINQSAYTSLELFLFPNDTMFIALGDNASKALKGIEHFKLPHPSGRNRQINNKSFIDKKLKECQKYIEERENEKHS